MERILDSNSYFIYVFRNKETGEYLDEDYYPTEDIGEAIGYSNLETIQEELKNFDEPDEWYIVKKITQISIIGEPIEVKKFI